MTWVEFPGPGLTDAGRSTGAATAARGSGAAGGWGVAAGVVGAGRRTVECVVRPAGGTVAAIGAAPRWTVAFGLVVVGVAGAAKEFEVVDGCL